MYLIYCTTLLLFVYISPALAIYPKLVLSTRTVVAIPFVSIFIIALIKVFLSSIGAFSHSIVFFISCGFLLIACIRVSFMLRQSEPKWPKPHQYIILLNLIIVFYFFTRLGTSSFASNDEIYSWNMWAIQHFKDEPIDYYYTRSPYPQLFPILVAYCYKVLGNIDLQLPVRALLAIFPFCLLNAIGIAPGDASFKNVAKYLVLMFVLVVGIGIKRYFDDGMADPMMASALIVSVFLFFQYARDNNHSEHLWLSVICGIVAAYTKQTALIWVFALPIISIISVLRKKLPPVTIAASTILFMAGIVWILGDGSGFYDNQGANNASQQGRDLVQQLVYAVNRYFFKEPLILLLLSISLISVIRTRKHLNIFVFLLVPSLLTWFVFGAYSLRIGVHIVCLTALLISATNYNLPFPKPLKIGKRIGAFFEGRMTLIMSITSLIVLIVSTLDIGNALKKRGDGFDLYIGGKNTIYEYFGKDSALIYEKIYKNPDILLWLPSNYVYGIFYGHNKIMRPNYNAFPKYDINSLVSEIKQYRPDYLFYSGPRVAYGPGSHLLHKLAEKDCPYLFERVAGPASKNRYIVYRLKKDKGLLSQCRRQLDK